MNHTHTSRATKRIAIVGGGPIGLEAALYGRLAGFDVDLYEKGPLAANMRDWGHVRLFSPFRMNASNWAQRAIDEQQPGVRLPGDDQFLTGREYADRYLLPLSRLPILSESLHEQTTVVGISRMNSWKADLIENPARGNDLFRLLLRDRSGIERDVSADYVLDCSGVYPHHNWLGAGGLPAVGETSAVGAIEYGVPDILGSRREFYAGQTTLVIGSGYSAATAITGLARLAESDKKTRAIWITRSERTPPLAVIDEDPLPERGTLTAKANRLAMSADSPITLMPQRIIQGIQLIDGQGGFRVIVRHREEHEMLSADRIVANVGYQPDRSLYSELQMHECYATSGPIKLAAALMGETSTDCLNQSSNGVETLRNPEPGFFILGAKSYGRDSRFLIRVGLEQIVDVYDFLAAESETPMSRKGEQGAQLQQ
ncbi:putative glutamate synthase subunit beta [Symmachiella macrocystis]|uniref:Putative glutamate synthase subunit beta n=1 Tax=Symmachiella macrocystis TaxID=2527985 RepID=A0A5C6BDA4_9PLAN|nr:monooxygenase [Symmachiella macrocystis]TWU09259.1 putative glutamate synthase subunit beta [Symmachiella macrocystis]